MVFAEERRFRMTVQEVFNQAVQHFHAKELAEAEAACRQILATDPSHADSYHLLGLIAASSGRPDVALQFIAQAISINSGVADFHTNLGVVLAAMDRLDESAAAYQQALALKPDSAEANSNLADVFCRKGDWHNTVEACRRALLMRPALPEALCNFGVALQNLGQFEEAVACYLRALTARPNYFQPMLNMGNALASLGRLDAAIGILSKCAVLVPNHPGPPAIMAGAMLARGGLNNAISAYDRALAIAPDPIVASARIAALEFHSDFDAPALLSECRAWDAAYAQPLRAAIAPHTNDRTPDRRLKIGYVSPDFCEGALGRAVLPLLRQHDRARFEVVCYSCSAHSDDLTNTLASHADQWRDLSRLDDASAAQLIRADGIDILIDLTLHGQGNRLPVFAHKPAPVQACFLGSVGTTGLTTMDWRLSDPHIDPPAEDLGCYSERTLRLPRTYWCYQPAGEALEIQPPPFQTNGYVTFGCLGRFVKSAASMERWGDILAKIENSRLLLSCPAGSARRWVEDLLAAKGINHDRVEFTPQPLSPSPGTPGEGWRGGSLYQRIDIALDPFPHGGAMTACDALWMGVPVITLSGQRAAGRCGRSILANIGLSELIASSADEYLHLALDWQRWTELRPNLRDRLRHSPLMDAAQWSRDIEDAYRQMWRDWTG